jgi:hypothetical protein
MERPSLGVTTATPHRLSYDHSSNPEQLYSHKDYQKFTSYTGDKLYGNTVNSDCSYISSKKSVPSSACG